MDNNYHELSARMSDGRFITDYSPNCELNFKLQNNMSSFQYRFYLTKYTDKIINDINQSNQQTFGCNSCQGNVPVLPKYDQQCYVNGYCKVNTINQNGIGFK
tara:strand:- start:50 stop:355 length:306 start_codon:yes stop_codon:yes gene_type:complete